MRQCRGPLRGPQPAFRSRRRLLRRTPFTVERSPTPTTSWIDTSVGPRSGPRHSRIQLRPHRLAASQLIATNAAPLSRTTPWSAARVPQSKTPNPHNAVHRRTIPDSDHIGYRDQRWTTEWSTTSPNPLSNPPPGGKPVDSNGRCGIVADHSVVRCRRSAVEDTYPAECRSPSNDSRL
jgi:hypothetical protein